MNNSEDDVSDLEALEQCMANDLSGLDSKNSDNVTPNAPPFAGDACMNEDVPLQQQVHYNDHAWPIKLQTDTPFHEVLSNQQFFHARMNQVVMDQQCYDVDCPFESQTDSTISSDNVTPNAPSFAGDACMNQDVPSQQQVHYDVNTLSIESQKDQPSQQQLSLSRQSHGYQHYSSAPIINQSENTLNQQSKRNLNPVDQLEFDALIVTVIQRLSAEQFAYLSDEMNQRISNDKRLEKETSEHENTFRVGQPFPNIAKHKGGWKEPRIDRKRKHGAKEIVAEPKSLGAYEYAKFCEKYPPVYELPDSIIDQPLKKKNLETFCNRDEFKEVKKMIENDPYRDEYRKYKYSMQIMIYLWNWMPIFLKIKEIFIQKGIQENEFPCYQYDGLNYWNDTYSRKVKGPNLKRQEARREIERIRNNGEATNGNNKKLEQAFNDFWLWDNALFEEFKTRIINTEDSRNCRERKKAETKQLKMNGSIRINLTQKQEGISADNRSHKRSTYLVRSQTSGSESLHSPVSYIE